MNIVRRGPTRWDGIVESVCVRTVWDADRCAAKESHLPLAHDDAVRVDALRRWCRCHHWRFFIAVVAWRWRWELHHAIVVLVVAAKVRCDEERADASAGVSAIRVVWRLERALAILSSACHESRGVWWSSSSATIRTTRRSPHTGFGSTMCMPNKRSALM